MQSVGSNEEEEDAEWVDEEEEEEEDEEDEDESEEEEEEKKVPWTSDGKDPYIFWHVNSHGAMNDHRLTIEHGIKKPIWTFTHFLFLVIKIKTVSRA